MLERVPPHELLDPKAFAESLSIEQAGYLILALKPTKHKDLNPLKLALLERVHTSQIKHGIGKRVMALFGKGRKKE